MSNCANCSTMAAAFAEEVERRNADNQMIAAIERFLAECRGSAHEFMTVDATGATMTTRRTVAGLDIVECPTCRDCTTVASDAEAAAFGYRHRHVNSDLPPSMEPKPKRSRTG